MFAVRNMTLNAFNNLPLQILVLLAGTNKDINVGINGDVKFESSRALRATAWVVVYSVAMPNYGDAVCSCQHQQETQLSEANRTLGWTRMPVKERRPMKMEVIDAMEIPEQPTQREDADNHLHTLLPKRLVMAIDIGIALCRECHDLQHVALTA
jgi:hypothetical protein